MTQPSAMNTNQHPIEAEIAAMFKACDSTPGTFRRIAQLADTDPSVLSRWKSGTRTVTLPTALMLVKAWRKIQQREAVGRKLRQLTSRELRSAKRKAAKGAKRT